MNGWGGKRVGAGRPKGSVKTVHNRRPQHAVAAFDNEWEVIRRFARLVKHVDIAACEKALIKLEAKLGQAQQ